jgi:hypothetical protein
MASGGGVRTRIVAVATAAIGALLVSSCGSDKAAAPSTTTPGPTPSTRSSSSADAVTISETSPVVYVLHTSDGVTVRYTILAPPEHELVKRVEDFHDNVRETRPVRLVLAEIDNQSTTDFEVSDIEVTEGDGDKVHFLEAWLLVGNWRRNITGQSDSPFYMESFDLDNALLNLGIVHPGATSVTVLGAEDFLETVASVTARERSGEMVPIQRDA